MSRAPERRIVGFHRDDDGWWVAELDCGHGRHMRHDPPWHVREWVTTDAGRAGMLGRTVACGKCPPADPAAGSGPAPARDPAAGVDRPAGRR